MTKQQAPSVTLDFSEIENGMNVILSMAQAVQSKRVRSDVLRGLKQVGHRRFVSSADVFAMGRGFEHMYENNRAGMPNARLFEMAWNGSGTSYNGVIVFKKASRHIPYPPSAAHLEAVEQANSNASRTGKTITLSQFVWETKAYDMETRSVFKVTPMGASNRRDGWIRTKPGSHAPAEKLMMKIQGNENVRQAGDDSRPSRIMWVDSYAWKNENQGQFTAFFHWFWDEQIFKTATFAEFERQYDKSIQLIFKREIMNARVSAPARIQSPGVHMISNGRRDMSRVTGKVQPGLVRRYEKAIGRAVLRNAR